MLLDVYTINLPMNSDLDEQRRREDQVSTRILQLFHPILLTTRIPLSVVGDGDCLHRATSLALHGTEGKHNFVSLQLWRCSSVMKMIIFTDPITDLRVVTATYQRLVQWVCGIGKYVEMMRMYALGFTPLIILSSNLCQ